MAGQLIPLPEHAPSLPREFTAEQGVAAWVDITNTCEQFLLAMLQQTIGPEEDVQDAYRQWYRRQMEEHDRVMDRMVDEFNRRSQHHGD